MIFKKSKKRGISLLYRDPENTCSEIKAFKNKENFVDFYFLKGSLSRMMGHIKINIDTTKNIHNIKNIQVKKAITKLNNVKSFIIDDYNVIDFTSDNEID